MAETDLHHKLSKLIKSGKTTEVLSLLNPDENPCTFTGLYKSTLLHLAAEHGNEELAKHLIDSGANVNAQDNIKQTPLAIAVNSDHENIVKALLDANADICVPNINGHSVFDRVFDDMEITKETIKQMILDTIPIRITNKLLPKTDNMEEKRTLREIIEFLDVKTKKFLFEYGTQNQERLKPLTLEIVKALINSSGKWNDYNSIEMLMMALLSNEEMKSVKIDVNACPKNKETLLHRAAKKGNTTFVQLLIQRGAKINAKDCYNRTPLFMAVNPHKNAIIMERNNDCSDRRYDCTILLLENGADPQIWTEDINQKYIAYFDYPPYKDITIKLVSPVIMEFVLQAMSGPGFNDFMLEKIMKNEKYKLYKTVLESSMDELEEMKKIEIVEGVNLFVFLTVKKISVYAHIKMFMRNLTKRLEDYTILDSYYYRKLQKRCTKFALVLLINQIFVEYYNLSASDVAEKIVNYAF